MEQALNPSATVVANASADARATFLRRTYLHLTGAIFAFVLLEALLLESPLANVMLKVASTRWGWLVVLGGFMFVSHLADRWARSGATPAKQYAGLGLYIIFEAVLFLPLMYMAAFFSSPDVLPNAAMVTVVLFGGLTGVVFLTGKDFTFMRGVLGMVGIGAMALIAGSILFGMSLGLWFSFAMVAFAGGSVLYNTSAMQHQYRTDQHVAASLSLFASVALMFWYVLRIFMSRD